MTDDDDVKPDDDGNLAIEKSDKNGQFLQVYYNVDKGGINVMGTEKMLKSKVILPNTLRAIRDELKEFIKLNVEWQRAQAMLEVEMFKLRSQATEGITPPKKNNSGVSEVS